MYTLIEAQNNARAIAMYKKEDYVVIPALSGLEDHYDVMSYYDWLYSDLSDPIYQYNREGLEVI